MHVFACQHGVEECVNNLFQACLFNKVVDPKLQVQLASCLMGSEDPHMKTKECMKKFNGKNVRLFYTPFTIILNSIVQCAIEQF